MLHTISVLTIFLFMGSVWAQPHSEWREYCEMTTHVKVDGWVVEKKNSDVLLKLHKNSFRCQVEHGRDYLGRDLTLVTMSLKVTQDLGHKLPLQTFIVNQYLNRKVTRVEACSQMEDFIVSEISSGSIKARVERELIKQEWSSSRNTDTYLVEKTTLRLKEGPSFYTASSLSARGKYCSVKPTDLKQ